MESNGLGCLIHEDQGADLAHMFCDWMEGQLIGDGLTFQIPGPGPTHPPTNLALLIETSLKS